MDQPCYKCGQAVEEGLVFCPHCGAPQIRVLVAEPVAAATGPWLSEPSSNPRSLPASETLPVLMLPVQWSQALKPCALAAVVGLVMIAMRLPPLVTMPVVGFLSIIFYRYWQRDLTIKIGAAIRIGAFGGLLSSGFIVVFLALAALVPESRPKLNEGLLELLQTSAANNPDSPMVRDLIQELRTPDGFVRVMIFLCFAALIFSLVLGGLGGAIAGAIFRRRER